MICVLMTYMTGALSIQVVTGDVSIMAGSSFIGNNAISGDGGMFDEDYDTYLYMYIYAHIDFEK